MAGKLDYDKFEIFHILKDGAEFDRRYRTGQAGAGYGRVWERLNNFYYQRLLNSCVLVERIPDILLIQSKNYLKFLELKSEIESLPAR